MRPLRVLVVEDEALVAFLIQDAIEESGHVVAATASNIKDALAAAARGDFDVALLDLNLNGQKAHALPITLGARGKPFAFVTGYGEDGVLSGFLDAPVVRKPFPAVAIGEALAALEARLSRTPDETDPGSVRQDKR